MKSEDLKNLVLSKYKDGQSCIKIYEDLHGSLGLSTVERWCKMIRDTGQDYVVQINRSSKNSQNCSKHTEGETST